MKHLLILYLITSFHIACGQHNEARKFTKNGMQISWIYDGDRIFIEMSAPSKGWIAVGFNNTENLTGTYLLMGNVTKEEVNVVEHYVLAPGDYRAISTLGESPQVEDLSGTEGENYTAVKFSLPIKGNSKYQKDLNREQEYVVLIAYSREDDFKHHSTMRTSVRIKL